MADDAVAVVERYLEALRRLDPALLAEISDEEFVFELPFAPDGMPKRVETKRAMIDFVRPVLAGLWKEIEFPTLEVRAEADPERVIAQYTSRGTFANGAPYKQTYVSLFRVRNGKIVYLAEYCDAIALAAGLTPPAG